MTWGTAVPITPYSGDIYVPLTENFPFLPVIPLTDSLLRPIRELTCEIVKKVIPGHVTDGVQCQCLQKSFPAALWGDNQPFTTFYLDFHMELVSGTLSICLGNHNS